MSLMPFAGMFVVTLFYFRELGLLGLAKYWATLIVLFLLCTFAFHSLLLSNILTWLVVVAAVLSARSADSLN